MTQHEAIREALLESTGEEVLAAEVREHLESCEECRAFAAALSSVDAQLGALPAIEASDALLSRTMERIEREEIAQQPSPGVGALLFGVASALFGGLWAMAKLLALPFTSRRARRWTLGGIGVAVPAVAATMLVVTMGAERDLAMRPAQSNGTLPSREEDTERVMLEVGTSPPAGDVIGLPTSEPAARDEAQADLDGRPDEQNRLTREEFALLPGYQSPSDALAENLDGSGAPAERTGEGRQVAQTIVVDQTRLDGAEIPPGAYRVTLREDGRSDDSVVVDTPADRRAQLDDGVTRMPTGSAAAAEVVDGRFAQNERGPAFFEDGDRGGELDEAAGFLAERSRIDGVAFVEASGHWATTYVPGDPAVRALRSRLAGSPAALALAERADQSDLALDAPSSGALALHVSTDRAAVGGRSRVLMSVGVRGAAARAGRRPTLQMQVVIDARSGIDEEGQARVRALLTALSRRRQGSDRIGVIVAGPHGGELLPLGSLRFGELTVALRRLFGESNAPPMSLEDAVRAAITSVGQLEDASSPLGSAVVLVVSPSLGEADARAIEPSVHAGTLAGVTTTALSTSDAASLDALERIAIAGQGRRRVLTSIDDADALVTSEVEAVSRVVARAVRLRIRLAPGVSLVDVIGSRRLDAVETRRVREAEQAVDRELARRLGITSDRDDDEDGIQIVMPAFYADDQHAVLLDLVVPGPGPVADVSMRWKDLVRVGNGSASERLTLASGTRREGPRERQVLAQLAAHELAAALRDAATMIDRGAVAEARARVESARRLVEGLRARIRADEMREDIALCAAYGAALAPGATTEGLADSLRYASRRRLHGEPLSIDGR